MDRPNRSLGQVRLKFCGLKTQNEIDLCQRLHIDFIGFVFCGESPRNISINDFNNLTIPINQQTVAVFRNSNVSDILSVLRRISHKFSFIQPHGLPLQGLQYLSNQGFKIIKPFSGEVFQEKDLAPFNFCNYFLFDGKEAGSGVERDFSFAKHLPTEKPFFLAGGINCGNAKSALQFTNMLDLSSGLESTRGVKSLTLMQEFYDQVCDVKKNLMPSFKA